VSENVGRQVAIYVRADDLELWRRAEAYARQRRMPTSGLVMLALERYLDAEDAAADEVDESR
jgi:predicted transcriptional regulator